MSAGTLRRAATRLREVASPVEKYAPWTAGWDSCDCGGGYPCGHPDWIQEVTFSARAQEVPPGTDDAPWQYDAEVSEVPTEVVEYWLSLPPVVAIALADWLDDVAASWPWDDEGKPTDLDGCPLTLEESTDARALALANTVLAQVYERWPDVPDTGVAEAAL